MRPEHLQIGNALSAVNQDTWLGVAQNRDEMGYYVCGGFRHKADRYWKLKKSVKLRTDGRKLRKGREAVEVKGLIPKCEAEYQVHADQY